MDPSLCLYNGKLKEAITIFKTMSHDVRWEAVDFWNETAEILRKILDNEATTPEINESLHIITDESIYSSSNNNCQESTLSAPDHKSPMPDSPLVTPAINPVLLDEFHEENLLVKSLFDNDDELLDASSLIARDCKTNNLDLLDNKLISESTLSSQITYAISQTELNLSSCSITPNNNTHQTEANRYNLMAHSNLLNQHHQVPNHHQHFEAKSIIGMTPDSSPDMFCTSINNNAQYTQSQVVDTFSQHNSSNLPPNSKLGTQMNLESDSAEFNDILINNSLSSSTSGLNEIEKSHYERGTKMFNESFSQFNQDISSLDSSMQSGNNDLFTQTERPLQEIQPFNENYYQPYVSSTKQQASFKHLVCQDCNKQLSSQEELNKHEQYHSLHGLLTPTSVDDTVDEADKLEFKKEANNQTNEIEQKSSATQDKKNNNINQHTCDVCGKSGFSTKGNLKRHQRAHSGEKPFKCEHCESCFTEKKSLKIHVRRHTGEKPYKCEICGKLFSQTGVLQSHMALHKDERKFECRKCDKAFRQNSQLKLHLMRHDGVKRLECSTCLAKFLTKGDLERHCRIHTGERPYACNICYKTFTRRQSLNEHMNRHNGKKPYDCKYCDKSFSEMSACYKHTKTHKKQDLIQQLQQQSLVLQQVES